MNTTQVIDSTKDMVGTQYTVDLLAVNSVVNWFGEITGLLLGIIAIGLVILMTLVTAIDVMYITLPIFRESIKRLRWDGSNDRGFSLVSRDALESVEESYRSAMYKSPISLYLSARLKSYIMSAVIIFIIVGGVDSIKTIVMAIVRGVLLAIMT